MNTYDTAFEKWLIEVIADHFQIGKDAIENPNQEIHQLRCREFKEKMGSGMLYFLELLSLPEFSGGVFLPFQDGMLGAGIWAEAEQLQKFWKHIFEITTDSKIKPLVLDESRMLTVEQTRERLKKWFSDGDLAGVGEAFFTRDFEDER